MATGKTAGKGVITQHCSVCGKDFEMEVVEKDDGTGVIWLRCPGCKGYLPRLVDEEGAGEAAGGGEPAELAPEDISQEEREGAKEYTESGEYEVDDVIYHRSWNDYGKVIAKETLPGNRKTIIVNFVNQGKIRLLEGVT